MKSLHRRIETKRLFRMVGIFASLCFLLGGAAVAQEEVAKEAMRLAAHKLPIPTKFITRDINA